jgi:hypothetical protein
VGRESIIENVTQRLAQEWVGGTEYNVTNVDAKGDQVSLAIHGSGEPPNLVALGEEVQETLNRFVTIKLTIVPSEERVYGSLE